MDMSCYAYGTYLDSHILSHNLGKLTKHTASLLVEETSRFFFVTNQWVKATVLKHIQYSYVWSKFMNTDIHYDDEWHNYGETKRNMCNKPVVCMVYRFHKTDKLMTIDKLYVVKVLQLKTIWPFLPRF